ncbi:hypothetical protein JTB14_030623 [Gonioctena quinquepunctata]|nr:hypothetical protein JTB14_030623 [Gonioctena quinquepunctata]
MEYYYVVQTGKRSYKLYSEMGSKTENWEDVNTKREYSEDEDTYEEENCCFKKMQLGRLIESAEMKDKKVGNAVINDVDNERETNAVEKTSKERSLETSELDNMSTTPSMGGRRHLSKSTSELSSPREMPEHRPQSAAPPEASHLSVYQKAHSFLAQLKNRLGHHSSKRDRRHKSPGRFRHDSTDYAADLSSDHSTPSTQSPKHKAQTRTGTIIALEWQN